MDYPNNTLADQKVNIAFVTDYFNKYDKRVDQPAKRFLPRSPIAQAIRRARKTFRVINSQ